MDSYRVAIEGEIVPFKRLARERWTDRATRYMSSKDAVKMQIRAGLPSIPKSERVGPWSVRLYIERFMLKGDVDNIVKAVLDAAQGELWDDDQTVLDIEVERRYCKSGEDRAALIATPLPVDRMPKRWIRARQKEGVLA